MAYEPGSMDEELGVDTNVNLAARRTGTPLGCQDGSHGHDGATANQLEQDADKALKILDAAIKSLKDGDCGAHWETEVIKAARHLLHNNIATFQRKWSELKDIGPRAQIGEWKKEVKSGGNVVEDATAPTELQINDTLFMSDIIELYVFVRPLSKFYDKNHGVLMTIPSFNQSESVTDQGKPTLAATYFKKYGGESVDGLGWMPCAANREPDRFITMGCKCYINTYEAPENVESCTDESRIILWLKMMAHIIPNQKEQSAMMDHMAATVQHPEKKIGWQILNYGAYRIGKDAVLRPMVKYFGSLASEISPEMSATQWGDTRAKKKMLIFAEVLQPGDRSFENGLKLLAAPTATGTDKINMKGGAIIEQFNLYSIYAMSNHPDCMHLSAGDARWFVIDSFDVKKRTAREYDAYFTWVDGGGWKDVIAWLLSRDLSQFTWGRPPYQTNAYLQLVEEGRSTIATIIAENIDLGMVPCANDLVSTTAVVDWLRERRYRVSFSLLRKEMVAMGCVDVGQGQKSVNGKKENTPRLMAVRNQENYSSLSSRELYDCWKKWC